MTDAKFTPCDARCYACLRRDATLRCEYDAKRGNGHERSSTYFQLCDHCHERLRALIHVFIGLGEVCPTCDVVKPLSEEIGQP